MGRVSGSWCGSSLPLRDRQTDRETDRDRKTWTVQTHCVLPIVDACDLYW